MCAKRDSNQSHDTALFFKHLTCKTLQTEQLTPSEPPLVDSGHILVLSR